MIFSDKKEILYLILAGFFITNAIVAEMIGGKLIDIGKGFSEGTFIMSAGIFLWPIVFLTTDLINEYFGKKAVRQLSFITAGLVFYAFMVLWMAMQVNAIPESPVNDVAFNMYSVKACGSLSEASLRLLPLSYWMFLFFGLSGVKQEEKCFGCGRQGQLLFPSCLTPYWWAELDCCCLHLYILKNIISPLRCM